MNRRPYGDVLADPSRLRFIEFLERSRAVRERRVNGKSKFIAIRAPAIRHVLTGRSYSAMPVARDKTRPTSSARIRTRRPTDLRAIGPRARAPLFN